MSTSIDWLAVIKRRGPDVPDSIRSKISKADQAFCRRDNAASAPEELLNLDSEMTLNLYEHLRVSIGAHAALLQRQFVFAVQSNQAPEHCFGLFENLSRAGFASTVEKARIIVILLQYLKDKLTPHELKPIVEAMADELESCRTGCEENLSALNTFMKADPDDSSRTRP